MPVRNQLSDLKSMLMCVSRDILALETNGDDLSQLESDQDKSHFEDALKIRRALQSQEEIPTHPDNKGGVELP